MKPLILSILLLTSVVLNAVPVLACDSYEDCIAQVNDFSSDIYEQTSSYKTNHILMTIVFKLDEISRTLQANTDLKDVKEVSRMWVEENVAVVRYAKK